MMVYILSLSNSGELAVNMAGIAAQDHLDLVESVQTEVHIPWIIGRALRKDHVYPFEYVLISGGGNDVLSAARIAALLRYRTCHEQDAIQCIDGKQLTRYLDRIGSAYQSLLDYIGDQPGYADTRIVTHTYHYVRENRDTRNHGRPLRLSEIADARGIASRARLAWPQPLASAFVSPESDRADWRTPGGRLD